MAAQFSAPGALIGLAIAFTAAMRLLRVDGQKIELTADKAVDSTR